MSTRSIAQVDLSALGMALPGTSEQVLSIASSKAQQTLLVPPKLDRGTHSGSTSSSDKGGSATDSSVGLSFGSSSTGTDSGTTSADEGGIDAVDPLDGFAKACGLGTVAAAVDTPELQQPEAFKISPPWIQPYSRPRSGTAYSEMADYGNDTDDESDSLRRVTDRPKPTRRHSFCLTQNGSPRSPVLSTDSRTSFKLQLHSPRVATARQGNIGTPPAAPTPSRVLFARDLGAAHVGKRTRPSLPNIGPGSTRGSFSEHRARRSSLLAGPRSVPHLKLDLAGTDFALPPGEAFEPLYGLPDEAESPDDSVGSLRRATRKATPYYAPTTMFDGLPTSLSPTREMTEGIMSPPQVAAAEDLNVTKVVSVSPETSIFSPRQPSKPLISALDGDDAMSPLQLDMPPVSILQVLGKAESATTEGVSLEPPRDSLPVVGRDVRSTSVPDISGPTPIPPRDPTAPAARKARRVSFADQERPTRDRTTQSFARPRTPGAETQKAGFLTVRSQQHIGGLSTMAARCNSGAEVFSPDPAGITPPNNTPIMKIASPDPAS